MFRSFSFPPHVDLSGALIPLEVKRHRRARRYVLRYHPLRQCVSLTLPRAGRAADALAFLESRRPWLEHRVRQHGVRVPLAHGAAVPVLGASYRICHNPQLRGGVVVEGDALIVHCAEEFLARRVRDWLRKRLLQEITALATAKAALLEKRVGRITLRDTSSCWGSCSRSGSLSFSWRLVFAPPHVLDYLVSHEVAHLRHMNHSRRFWETVEQLCAQWREARRWLREEGQLLYRYG